MNSTAQLSFAWETVVGQAALGTHPVLHWTGSEPVYARKLRHSDIRPRRWLAHCIAERRRFLSEFQSRPLPLP